MKIREQLYRHRIRHNLSQKDMAKKLGLSAVTYIHLEQGKKNLSYKTIAKLSETLCLTPEQVRKEL